MAGIDGDGGPLYHLADHAAGFAHVLAPGGEHHDVGDVAAIDDGRERRAEAHRLVGILVRRAAELS